MIDHKQLENVECFKYLGSVLTNNGRCTCEIKSRIVMAKAAFNNKKNIFTSTLDLNLRKKVVKFYIWNMALYGAETRNASGSRSEIPGKFWNAVLEKDGEDQLDQSCEKWRRVEQRNILHEIRKQKANWIGHILRRNCLQNQVIEGKMKGEIEVTRRGGRRCKKLLDDHKDRRGYSHLKEEALDYTMWKNRFGRRVGPLVRQITEWMNSKFHILEFIQWM